MASILTEIHSRRYGLGPLNERIQNYGTGPQSGYQAVDGSYYSLITSAQVLALFATPIAVMPAPGAGLAIIPRMVLVHKPAGTAYAAIAAGEDLVLKYTNAAGAQCSGVIETTGFLDQATAQTRYVGMQASTGATASDVTPAANAAVVMHLLVGEVTTGTSALHVRVWYDVVPTVFTGPAMA